VIFGRDRNVQSRDGEETTISTSCIQFSDGSIDTAGVIETAAVAIDQRPFTTPAARQLAAAIIEAAGDIDGWAQR
jgi:hypothetical protein